VLVLNEAAITREIVRMSMQEIINDLADIDRAISGVEVSRSRHELLGQSEGTNWKADEAIKSSLSVIIQAGNAASDACTKLVLVRMSNCMMIFSVGNNIVPGIVRADQSERKRAGKSSVRISRISASSLL
jgi:hypothetical protein